jgi:hypothetical protein
MLCPICNGFDVFQAVCPQCQHAAEDLGRLGDLYGPYSPYRPIDDIRMTNGYPDLQHHQCLHAASCSGCGHRFIVQVKETDRF